MVIPEMDFERILVVPFFDSSSHSIMLCCLKIHKSKIYTSTNFNSHLKAIPSEKKVIQIQNLKVIVIVLLLAQKLLPFCGFYSLGFKFQYRLQVRGKNHVSVIDYCKIVSLLIQM